MSRFFFQRRAACRGWTLVELAVVITIGAFLVFGAVLLFRPLDAQSYQQADRLRNDLRHMQMLALAWGQALELRVAGPSYSVSCVTAGVAPCDVSPVRDPATGQSFSVTLTSGLTLSGPGFTLNVDSIGRPRNGASLIISTATYTVSGASSNRTVQISPLTGFMMVQ